MIMPAWWRAFIGRSDSEKEDSLQDVKRRRIEKVMNSGSSDSNQIGGVKLEHWRWLTEYYFNRMSERRSIQMKVFTGFIVLILALANAAIDVKGELTRILFPLLAVALFLIFGRFVAQIEEVSKEDRERYAETGDLVYRHMWQDDGVAPREEERVWAWYPPITETAGAAKWPICAAFVLVVACSLAVARIP